MIEYLIMTNKKEILHTSSGGIVIRNNEVLLIEILQPYSEIIFPKGRVKIGETLENAALREVAEETGYYTRVIAPIGSIHYEFEDEYSHTTKDVSFFLLALTDDLQNPTPHLEAHEFIKSTWVDIGDAFKLLTHENTKQLLHTALEKMNILEASLKK